MNPLVRFPNETITLPPAYFGGIDRYVAIAAHGGFAVDAEAKFDKRLKSTHRCTIVDTRGPLHLTMPIAKPESYRAARWGDIIISHHGNWAANHLTALESAYGRTPFFEFYIDRFSPILREAPGRRLVDVDTALEAHILEILTLPPARQRADDISENVGTWRAMSDQQAVGFNQTWHATSLQLQAANPYWQIRAATLGFTPGLSILDLIFNLGPEAPLHLLHLLRAAPGTN